MTARSTLLYLSQSDIEASLPPIAEQLDLAERALIAIATDQAEVPPKIGVHPRPGTVVHAMLALSREADVVGMKWISTYPDNPRQGMPPNDALIILDDPETGRPHYILDGRRITALRTAAVSGVAMRHYRPRNVDSIVLIGAGIQGRSHAAVVAELFPTARLHIVDRHPERAAALASAIAASGAPGPVTSGSDWEKPVAGADILVTAAALGSASQILLPNKVRPEVLIVSIDADTHASAALARAAAVFAVDDAARFDVYLAEGAFAGFPAPATTIGAALNRPRPLDGIDRGIVLISPLGFGLTDILFADDIRRRAEAAGRGQLLQR